VQRRDDLRVAVALVHRCERSKNAHSVISEFASGL
jgi:hypothetical protein